MMNEPLIASVREQLFAGLRKGDIKRTLMEEGGWSEQDVNEAFAVVERHQLSAQMAAPVQDSSVSSTPSVESTPSAPSVQIFSLRWWPRAALAALLLIGGVAAAFATVPAMRSFVLGESPSFEEERPTSPGVVPEARVGLEPTASPSLLPELETPPETVVQPVVTQPARSEGSTPPPPSTTVSPVDTTAPAISLTSPANGATVSGSSVVVSANASDKVGVVSVQFKLDGTNLDSADTVAPYNVVWDTKKVASGKHTLSVAAKDAAGNVGTATSITVTVNNAVVAPTPTPTPTPTPIPTPTPDTTAPTAPANLSASVISSSQLNLTWNASTDAVGVTGYKLERCTGSSCTNYVEVVSQSGSGYNDTGLSAATTYRYRVRATDAAGNLSLYSSVVSGATQAPLPTPDATAPTVSLSAPTNGSTVFGASVAVSATASDNIGVVGVQFKLDGANLGAEDTSSPYTTTWNTTTASNGTHTITAVARDAAGNQTTSTSVSVTVSNTTPDTTAPTAPANLSASVISSSQLNLTWNASTDAVGVTGYKLERCTGSSCTNYVEVVSQSGSGYNDTGLSAATTYRYRVRATDAAGNLSGYSTVVSGTTQAAAPTTVTMSMGENAYSPVNLTIALGTTVVFRNDWSSDRWPASDSHPSHTIYPAFDPLQAVLPGASWSFTFTQAGTWGYHDHLKPSIGGLITVQ